MKKKYFIVISLFFIACYAFSTTAIVKADDFNDVVNEELDNIDLNEFSDFLSGISDEVSLGDLINKIIKGEYEFDYGSFLRYAVKIFATKVSAFLPDFFLIAAIILLSCLFNGGAGYVLSDEISSVILFVFTSAILVILLKDIFYCIEISKNLLENISKLMEIMSPIILTLVVAAGGSSAYLKPSLILASGSFTFVITSVVIPLVLLHLAFTVLGSINKEVDFSGFTATLSSIIKLIIGLLVTVFGIFSAVTGLASRSFDGISVKVTKYLLSSSVPLVGGMVKDGLDVFILGCSFIKNALGIVGVFAIFYMTIPPLFLNFSFMLLCRLSSSFSGIIGEKSMSKITSGVAESLKYLNVALMSSSFSALLCVLTMTISLGNVI